MKCTPFRCATFNSCAPTRRAIRFFRNWWKRRSRRSTVPFSKQLPGKTILLGVLDLSTNELETPEVVAARIRRALPHIDPKRLVIAPDYGMKYLTREVAFGKMCAMVEGATMVREELA